MATESPHNDEFSTDKIKEWLHYLSFGMWMIIIALFTVVYNLDGLTSDFGAAVVMGLSALIAATHLWQLYKPHMSSILNFFRRGETHGD